jgi:1-acyl-sn-glycerol-3-phosphate acyltransferase
VKRKGEPITTENETSKTRRLQIASSLWTLFLMVWTVLVTILFGIVAIAGSFFDRSGNFSHVIARIWAKSILFVGRINVTVNGRFYIDPSRSYIYMSNHQSNFDIPVLLSQLKIPFRWLAKAELFGIPLFGAAMKRAGCIRIDRSDRDSAIKSLNRAVEIIRKGVSVMIFPEGTRSRDGHIRPFKKGGFVMAVDSGAPIVPIIVHGTRHIMPRERLRIAPGKVEVEIRKPIETTGYTRENKDDLMEKVRNTICEAFNRGREEKP